MALEKVAEGLEGDGWEERLILCCLANFRRTVVKRAVDGTTSPISSPSPPCPPPFPCLRSSISTRTRPFLSWVRGEGEGEGPEEREE